MKMKRKVIRASESIAEEKGLRVINVSLDVVVPDHANDNQIASDIEDILNDEFDGTGVCRIAAAEVGGDITSNYEYDYPEEIFL